MPQASLQNRKRAIKCELRHTTSSTWQCHDMRSKDRIKYGYGYIKIFEIMEEKETNRKEPF